MSIKKPAGCCPGISMLRNLKVLLGQTGGPAGIQMDQGLHGLQEKKEWTFHPKPNGQNNLPESLC